MKKKIWGVLLSVAVLVTTVNFPTTAGAEENKGGADASGIVVKVSDDMNGSNANESDEIQTVQISAQNQSNMDAVVRIFLLNEDKETADTEVEIPNLCDKDQITDETVQTEMAETLKSALTLESGTNSALDAQWIEKKDDSGNVTAKYLEAALPAGAAAAFDMQLMYRTDEENYTKKTIVRAKAFVDEQDVTEASDREEEDNEAEVKWEVVKMEEESEAAGEDEETAGSAAKVSRAAENNGISLMSSATANRSAELNESYIYLDPTGMDAGGIDWTNSATTVYLCVDTWVARQCGTYDTTTGYWYWDASQWSNTAHTFYFTTSTDSGENGGNYSRSDSLGMTLDQALGKIFSWDGSSSTQNGNYQIYKLQEGIAFDLDDHTWFAGKTMWFQNNTDTSLPAVTAIFYEKNAGETLEEVTKITMTNTGDGQFSTIIPEEACSYVRFINPNNDEILGDDYSNFYGQGEDENNVESFIFNTSDKYCYLYNGSAEDSAWDARTSGTTVYFDATLSKLSYVGDSGTGTSSAEWSMPLSYGNLYCYAFGNSLSPITVKMDKVSTHTEDGNTWEDVYSADLHNQYETVIFYTNTEQTFPNDTRLQTVDLDVDWSLKNPCFYADSSDANVYTVNEKRNGYWGEVYTIRDAGKAKGTDVVDITNKDFQRKTNTRYVTTTFYDWYTDYELNGNNRDNYNLDSNATNINSHRIYQPFRQLNQALSSYYVENSALSPIYWGNFQNYTGNPFYEIGDALGLFGYERGSISTINNQYHSSTSDTYKKFFYNNNSMWGRSGNVLSAGTNAVQGLVSDTLSTDGSLQIQTSIGSVDAPYFDEGFINGTNNSKNTRLGEVYDNVEFPFELVSQGSYWKPDAQGTVDYWTFDSSKTAMSMLQDNGDYYLERYDSSDAGVASGNTEQSDYTAYGVNGQVAEGNPTGSTNFFPFNSSEESGKATKLNYGFGMRMDIEFRLTSDGMVETNRNDDVPIEFNFSGDDDVWIFIDGKLALDIGGAHGIVTGSLNFHDKKYEVINIKNGDSISKGEGDFSIDEDRDVHTLTMFYMERGLWESNMSVSYNFPDENLFEVEKEVDDSQVNEVFQGLFDSADIFEFTIKNAVTQWGTVDSNSEIDSEDITYNDSFEESSLSSSAENITFEQVNSISGDQTGRNNLVHWSAQFDDDTNGTYVEQRWGIITPQTGNSVNAARYTGEGSEGKYEYLSFDFYFDHADRIPALNNAWVEMEDENGQTVRVRLSSQNTFGSGSLESQTWETVQVKLSSFAEVNPEFDFTKISKVKFAFRYARDIYLDNIQFIAHTTLDIMTGFTVQQEQISDYGSVEANQRNEGEASLQNAVGAVYTVESEGSSEVSYGRIGANGRFALGDGDTASFSNQFRRGSYISLEETGVNKAAFSTSWSLYENGALVTEYGSGSTVEVADGQNGNLNDVSGYALEDGRTEVPGTNSSLANYTVKRDTSEPSIVFRSYADPDNDVVATKLKAVVTNKVNVGSIYIKKAIADGATNDMEGKIFRFEITFTNVAGASLENTENPPRIYVNVPVGETVEVEGIPLMTDYVVTELGEVSSIDATEVMEESQARLESISVKKYENGTVTDWTDSENPISNGMVEIDNGTVHGVLTEESSDVLAFQFNNTDRPLLDIEVEKKWKDVSGTEISGTSPIYVQLQRSFNGTDFEPVQVNNQYYVTITRGYDGWKYTFTGLDKYFGNISEGTPESWTRYIYRIVEGTVSEGVFTPVERNGIIVIGDRQFVVDAEDITGQATDESEEISAIITNTRTYNLQITKVSASENNEKLGGVEFKLEKGSLSGGTFTPGSDSARVETTSSDDETKGLAVFSDLTPGTYRITETKTQSGYSLLKSPLFLIVDGNGRMTIQEGIDGTPQDISSSFEDNTIKITVSNRLLFELPSTGGYLRAYMIAGGLALAGVALFIYRLQKRRKGARAPRR